jgi:hypothetical protein
MNLNIEYISNEFHAAKKELYLRAFHITILNRIKELVRRAINDSARKT